MMQRWRLLLGVVLISVLFAGSFAFAADAPARTKIRIATAAPSLSYFPIYAAVQKGFFARRGFDVEMIQMAASLTAAALLNRAVDYTIIPSTIATAAARGAAAKVIMFASVKLQHTLVVRADINAVTELAGRKSPAAASAIWSPMKSSFSSSATSSVPRPPSSTRPPPSTA